MKKVLQISNYFYPNRGGIEQVTRDIAGAIRESYEQKIICFNETASDGTISCQRRMTTTDLIDGVEVIRCGCITKKASQSISLTFPGKLKEILNDFQPDIIIFHYPNPYQAHFLLKHLNDSVRFIIYWHLDITRQKILGKLFNRQTLRLIDQADIILGATPAHIDGSFFLSWFEHKCRVMPYCIEPQRLQATETILKRTEEIRNENSGKILCFAIGRHIPYKGFTYLIQASKCLDDRFRIIIAGSGPLTDQLKEEAEEDPKISFPGRISDEDLIAYYLAMDIFCFPSITKNECFGLALAEAMSFQKPAVTFTIPGSGVNYVNLKNVTGLEVPNRDAKAYAEALICLADNPALRQKYGENGAERVRTLFSPEVFKMNMLNLLSGTENT